MVIRLHVGPGSRDVVNGKAAALPELSDTLTLSQLGGEGGRLCPPIGFASTKKIVITPLRPFLFNEFYRC